MSGDWSDSREQRRAQLPCENRGAYPKWVIPVGTRLRIKPRGSKGEDWRWHTTKRELVFESVKFSNDSAMWFEFEAWTIYVRRELVEH